jgi:hypothetical protein
MTPSPDHTPLIVIHNDLCGNFTARTRYQAPCHATPYEAMSDNEIGPFACQAVAEHFAAEITQAAKRPFETGKKPPVMEAIRRAVEARHAASLSEALNTDALNTAASNTQRAAA